MKKRSSISGFVAILLIGAVAGGVLMRSDNSAREEHLDSQYARLDKERDSAAQMRELGDEAFRDYAVAVHEQSRVARNIQERLHEQELALAGAENGWIRLVIVCIAVTVLAVLWIGKSTEDRARITIQNALGLPPAGMREYLTKAQVASSAFVPELETDTHKIEGIQNAQQREKHSNIERHR
jgi:hypothetical protein